MSKSIFKFKLFSIHHQHSFKVGTDGVLIGAWTDIPNGANVLDIGTGSGLIALMINQRSPFSKITAIEIDEESAQEATKNVLINGKQDKISIFHTSLNKFTSNSDHKFDLIISNPPFFQNDLIPHNDHLNLAKHNKELNISELVLSAKELISSRGIFSFILPYRYLNEIKELLLKERLYIHRICLVRNSSKHPFKRVMISCSKEKLEKVEEELIIRGEDGRYSKEYIELCSSFYL